MKNAPYRKIMGTILYNQNLDYCLKLLIETVKILIVKNFTLIIIYPFVYQKPLDEYFGKQWRPRWNATY